MMHTSKSRLGFCLVIALLLITIAAAGFAEEGDAAKAAVSADKDVSKTPLIPRDVLFGNPDRAAVRLSPDGKKISFLAPVDGVLNVWVGPYDDPDAAKPVTSDTKRGIRIYFWAFTSSHIIYLQDKDGDENWRVYCVDLGDGGIKELTPSKKVHAQIVGVSYKMPNEILVGLNDRDPRYHDVYRVNLLTGEKEMILKNKEFAGFFVDDDFNIRFAVKVTSDGGTEYMRRTDDGKWESYIKIEQADTMTTYPISFDGSGEGIYLVDSRGRNTAALYHMDLKTREKKLLVEDDRADIIDVRIHRTKKVVLAAASYYERKKWYVLDESVREDFDYLKQVADGDVEVTSCSLDEKQCIVAYILDNGPVRYYRYDREAKKVHYLFTNNKALEGLPLAKMHPVVIESRDGLKLVNYYTLPLGADANGDKIPDKPLPTVLFVHGGPWHRDTWGYSPIHQWLANRGYAVLSVNFRGSTGFGKNFINASDMEWGAKMHDDLIDSVKWAVEQKIADPGKVAIAGGSYGGYATLVGVAMTPDVFACGVDIVGPSNLVTLLKSIPEYWKPVKNIFRTRVGDDSTKEGREFLLSRSPITYVDQIKKPLLIGQGANDPRVKQAESDQIVKAMKKKNIPVTYVLYPDEGHGFARPENRLSFFAVTEIFLAECLGGRYEPIGDDFKGSSITVPEGAGNLPGLTEALEASGQ